MRVGEIAQLFQVGQLVAYGGGTHLEIGCFHDRGRADRLGGLVIVPYDRSEFVLLPWCQLVGLDERGVLWHLWALGFYD
jgi:hypothetical protein